MWQSEQKLSIGSQCLEAIALAAWQEGYLRKGLPPQNRQTIQWPVSFGRSPVGAEIFLAHDSCSQEEKLNVFDEGLGDGSQGDGALLARDCPIGTKQTSEKRLDALAVSPKDLLWHANLRRVGLEEIVSAQPLHESRAVKWQGETSLVMLDGPRLDVEETLAEDTDVFGGLNIPFVKRNAEAFLLRTTITEINPQELAKLWREAAWQRDQLFVPMRRGFVFQQNGSISWQKFPLERHVVPDLERIDASPRVLPITVHDADLMTGGSSERIPVGGFDRNDGTSPIDVEVSRGLHPRVGENRELCGLPLGPVRISQVSDWG